MSRPLQPALPWRLSPAHTHSVPASQARILTLSLITLTCIGFALRLTLLNSFPLREDEAIYGYWARAATSDPFFLHTWPDKPPLFIWLLTAAFSLWGPSAAGARLVSIFAGTLTIPLVALGAQRLWRSSPAAALAALFLTFNPYAISFAPTAYTDSLLVLLGTGAIVAALSRRGFVAGLLLAAACMTKQQGLFYAPLVMALLCFPPYVGDGPPAIPLWFAHLRIRFAKFLQSVLSPRRGLSALWVTATSGVAVTWLGRARKGDSHRAGGSHPPSTTNWERPLRGDKATARGLAEDTRSLPLKAGNQSLWQKRGAMFTAALLGAALITLPILWWDSQRWAVAPSPWALAQRTYAPLTWLPPPAWPARWDAWAKLLWYLGDSWVVWAMLAVALLAVTLIAWRRPRRNLPLVLLWGWGIAFLVLHLITSVQAWDRYLLPLAPWLALLASGPLARIAHMRLPEWRRGLLLLLLIAGMTELIPTGLEAARGHLPVGADHGDYAGLTKAIAWVESQDTPAILYHQVLGWHFRFYLYDETQPQGDQPPRFDLRWFPSAAYLADNAAKSPYPPKYLIVPDWATPPDLALHLAMRGLALEPRLHVGRFEVMEIVQPPRPPCDWCKSALPRSGGLPFSFVPLLEQKPQMSMPSSSLP